MAEGDGHVYRGFKAWLMLGLMDLSSDTIKASLVAAYVLDEDGHDQWSDASTKEITDASYSAQTLTGMSVTVSGTGTGTAVKGKFDAANVTFASLTGTDPNYLILWDDQVTGTKADPLMIAFELTTATNGGDYQIQWNANGILRIQ
jgi:hypothetical protein